MEPFTWDPSTGRYRWPNGRFVSWATIRNALETAIEKEKRKGLALLVEFRDGGLTLARWRLEMRDLIKSIHFYSGALARGGWAQLNGADYGLIETAVYHEFRFLERLARGISNRTIPVDGRVTDRVRMYMEAGRDTFFVIEGRSMADAGFLYESNHLSPVENCVGCVGETARGRVPIGDLIPIGRRNCLRKCKCWKQYWMTLNGST